MGQPLSFIPPIEITPARLTATNIPMPDTAVGEVEWVVGTTYALGARVIVSADLTLYESLQAGNVGKAPATNPTWWVKVSAANRYRMFDTINSSQSTRAGLIDVTVTPSSVVNSLALLNIAAQSVRVRMTDPVDGVVYDQTFVLQAPPLLANWWNYFFDPITNKTDFFVSLPSYGSASIRVEIVNAATAACGAMLIGSAIPIGDGVEYGASLGIQDYSRKERNEFGDIVLVERSFAKRASYRMLVPNGDRPSVNRLLAQYRAKPSLWVGVEGEEDTYIYGIYKDYQFVIEFTEHSVLTLDLEGLT
jgi:hypothetical protein